MKVALVSETYPPEVNGVARTLERLAAGLGSLGHRVEVIRPRPALPLAPCSAGVTQIVVRGMPLPRYPALRLGAYCARRLERHWRLEPPQVVHVATEGPLGLAALTAARRRGCPVASSFHTDFPRYVPSYGLGWLRRPGAAYLRWFHNRAARTLVPTEELRGALAAQGFRRLAVLGRGVDAQLFRPDRSAALRQAWGAAEDVPVVLHVGRLAPEKNVALLERAARALRAAQPRSPIVLVGDGPEAAALARHNPDFVFSGERRGEDLAAHYAAGDIFLFPSLTETFGNVVLEAMASGLAVVAFDYAGAGALLGEGAGALVPRDSGEAGFIARAVELAADAGGLRAMGERARQAALRCDWPRVVAEFERHLLAVAAGE